MFLKKFLKKSEAHELTQILRNSSILRSESGKDESFDDNDEEEEALVLWSVGTGVVSDATECKEFDEIEDGPRA